mmetsp:Transcript_20947/g.17360  ORF Transcript_20947/g.17360 Transcript_20947/m.17360 type:complete len:121 (+) Transcript_20947:181-543(+)
MVIFAGQLADAITTPLCGYVSDKFDSPIGKRIPLYIFGMILLLISFLPVWNVPCDFPEIIHQMNPQYEIDKVRLYFYIVMSVLSNVGWACVQINHLALIPQITLNEEVRTELVGMRQSLV